jgi:DNA-binding Lrp family transcriptional regulator
MDHPRSIVFNVDFVTLDELDRRIIHALYVHCRAPFSLLAEVLDTSEQTVARRYRRLRDGHILRVVGELDSQRLGQSDWAVRIRCTPGSSMAVAAELARLPETAWVQLTSGGTEIFLTIHAHDRRHRTPLLLGRLQAGRQVVGLEAYCLLHLFTTGPNPAPWATVLSDDEVAALRPEKSASPSGRAHEGDLHDTDWPLIQALAEDGRATYRELATRTHWHESTVRRRIDELTSSGVLFFDLDVRPDAMGVNARAVLWMSVAPSQLTTVGTELAGRPEVPFVAATTGSTNLVVSLACRDDRDLYEYLTREIAALEGVTHFETAPIMESIKMHATMVVPTPASAT